MQTCSGGDGGGVLDLQCLADAMGFEGGGVTATEEAEKMVVVSQVFGGSKEV